MVRTFFTAHDSRTSPLDHQQGRGALSGRDDLAVYPRGKAAQKQATVRDSRPHTDLRNYSATAFEKVGLGRSGNGNAPTTVLL
jgi:hypothetical protein